MSKRSNPLLMTVMNKYNVKKKNKARKNIGKRLSDFDQKEIDKLWQEVTKQWQDAKQKRQDIKQKLPDLPELDFSDFIQTLESFVAQHHILPKTITLEDVSGLDPNIKIMSRVGTVKNIWYKPDEDSRKSPYEYYHPTQKEALAVDKTGKVLSLYGSSYMDNRDGWLHK